VRDLNNFLTPILTELYNRAIVPRRTQTHQSSRTVQEQRQISPCKLQTNQSPTYPSKSLRHRDQQQPPYTTQHPLTNSIRVQTQLWMHHGTPSCHKQHLLQH
jgi:hypothetical protein